jgi:predicted N-formylglutamate amidohydrolase
MSRRHSWWNGPHGRSPFFLTADHAGQAAAAQRWAILGLDAKERGPPHCLGHRHCRGFPSPSRFNSTHFLILQTYSRLLVIDCNRSPEADSSIVTVSELTTIPGNQNLKSSRTVSGV